MRKLFAEGMGCDEVIPKKKIAGRYS